MKKPTGHHFDRLLDLMSDDRGEAGIAYERLRTGLIRFFRFRGCNDEETLADRTFERVEQKADAYDSSRHPSFNSFVFGFARNIAREHQRRSESQLEPHHGSGFAAASTSSESRYSRLDQLSKCLNSLAGDEGRLLMSYYKHDGREKIRHRQQLASEAGCSSDVLYVRVFRLKGRLRECVDQGTLSGSA